MKTALVVNTSRLPKTSLAQLVKRPETNYADLPDKNPNLTAEEIQQVEIALKYAGYISRQEEDVQKFKTMEDKQIPPWMDYAIVPSLRKEARQKLERIRPQTLGQASRISGVSPADVSLLIVWMKRGPQQTMCAAAEHQDAIGRKKAAQRHVRGRLRLFGTANP